MGHSLLVGHSLHMMHVSVYMYLDIKCTCASMLPSFFEFLFRCNWMTTKFCFNKVLLLQHFVPSVKFWQIFVSKGIGCLIEISMIFHENKERNLVNFICITFAQYCKALTLVITNLSIHQSVDCQSISRGKENQNFLATMLSEWCLSGGPFTMTGIMHHFKQGVFILEVCAIGFWITNARDFEKEW